MKNEVDPGFNRELAAMIDHTLLKPEATAEQITKLCQEALQYEFKSVCINPFWVPLAAMLLKGSKVNICTVIGFPLGAITSEAKADEAREAVRNGAAEVDMVINIGALKSGQYDVVLHDIQCVVHAVKRSTVVKVILETGLLTDSEKVKACELCKEAGADFVKTSTGFGAGGATVEDIRLMRETVGEKMGVKASGGIRDYETAMAMIHAGANRIGASSGIAIVTHNNQNQTKGDY
jgi:deoxyribose-phosphate aldolase